MRCMHDMFIQAFTRVYAFDVEDKAASRKAQVNGKQYHPS